MCRVGPAVKSARRLPAMAALLGAMACTGCAVPSYDVPRDEYAQPTVRTIIERIQCELRDMVRDDRPGDPAAFHRLFLLNGDYEVVASLSLEVNDAGGLAPSVTYLTPLGAAASLTVSANATLNASRDHTFSENVQLSIRQIYQDWKSGLRPYDCPAADTHLSGALGVKDLVSMAASTPELSETTKDGRKGVFGGTIQFVVTKSLTAAGPAWALVRFRNISLLGNLSEINTDRITLAFAQGSLAGKRLPQINGYNAAGYQFLQQQLLNSINSQLVIQNSPR